MLICTPVQEKTQEKANKRLQELKNKADLAEVWIDQIRDLDLRTLIGKAALPLVVVCKKPAEKGAFRGSWADVAVQLENACKFGAEYVDIPFNMPKNLSKKVVHSSTSVGIKKKTKIIISHHDFRKTPSSQWMLKTARAMKKSGADIVKIAVMARSLEDTFNLICLAQRLQAEKIPHILIAMGKGGVLSRIITPFLGGTIMFAPLKASRATASGQLTVAELKKAWSLIKK
ncbi:type I 3-dehydroquinate dehydratase [Candidatus Peregrinibacteria bacterium]|nr:type I 3-dehydroquinate dehydratase [Candidatus Peregrinibacteria bacterium]